MAQKTRSKSRISHRKFPVYRSTSSYRFRLDSEKFRRSAIAETSFAKGVLSGKTIVCLLRPSAHPIISKKRARINLRISELSDRLESAPTAVLALFPTARRQSWPVNRPKNSSAKNNIQRL